MESRCFLQGMLQSQPPAEFCGSTSLSSILRSRLLATAQRKQQTQIAQSRKSQVGTGERSEKIRTYNFPQTRVTDHRLNLTLHQLENILDGELGELIDALILQHQAQQLEEKATLTA